MDFHTKKRANNRQIEFLIDQLHNNIDLARGSPVDPGFNELWSKITLQLNTMGCKREILEWQHIWTLRMAKVRNKAKAVERSQNSGGSPGTDVTLSETEKKILAIAEGLSVAEHDPYEMVETTYSMQTIGDPNNISASTSTQCRVCLKSGQDHIPIFTQNSVLAEQLQLICGINICINDGYPQHLCISCSHLLQVAVLFRKTAESSQLKLMSLSETQSPIQTLHFKMEIEDSEGSTQNTERIKSKIMGNLQSIEANDNNPLIPQNYLNIEIKYQDEGVVKEIEHNKTESKIVKIEIDEKTEDVLDNIEEQDDYTKGNKATDNVLKSNQVLKKLSLYAKYYRRLGKLNNKPVFECKICNKRFNKRKTIHIKEHFSDGPLFVCEECGKSFTSSTAFYSHRARPHQRELIFNCEECPYKGRTKDLLKNHMKVHSTEYRYVCPVCSKTFQQACNYTRHVRRHGKPTVRCEFCDRLFYENNDLKMHIANKHEDNFTPSTCNVCGNTFKTKKLLFRHERRVHKRKIYTNNRAHYLKEDSKDTPDATNSL